MKIKNLVIPAFVLFIMSGCTSVYGPGATSMGNREYSDISEYKVTGKQIARAVNDVGPDINNIDTCPPGMTRYDHKSEGSADSNIKTTEKGTTFTHTVEFGQSHKCKQ